MAILDVAPGRLVQHLEETLGLSESELAQALEINPRTIERWRTGASYPQRNARDRLAALSHLTSRLGATFTTGEATRAWLRERNRYLGGLAPADLLRLGRIDRVEAAIEALDSGFFV